MRQVAFLIGQNNNELRSSELTVTTSDSTLTMYLGTHTKQQHNVVNILPYNISCHPIAEDIWRLRSVHLCLHLAAATCARTRHCRNLVLQLLKPCRKLFVSPMQDLDFFTQSRVELTTFWLKSEAFPEWCGSECEGWVQVYIIVSRKSPKMRERVGRGSEALELQRNKSEGSRQVPKV